MWREDVGRSAPDLEGNLQNIDLEGSFVTVVYCHIYIIVSKKKTNEIAPEDLKIWTPFSAKPRPEYISR